MKNIKKLVALSLASATLAGVLAPAAEAAIVINGKTYTPDTVQVSKLSQQEYLELIKGLVKRIDELKPLREGHWAAIDAAQSAYNAALGAYNNAVAVRDSVEENLNAAIADRIAKAARKDELGEALRLINRDFAAEKRVALEKLNDALAQNVITRNAAVEEANNREQAAENALNQASQAVANAQNLVYALPDNATAEERAEANRVLSEAQAVEGTARAAHTAAQAQAEADRNAAEGAKVAADNQANATYDQAIRTIDAAYTDAQKIYRKLGIQGDAQAAYDSAVNAYNNAVATEAQLEQDLAAAREQVATTGRDLQVKYSALRGAQRAYYAVEEELRKAELLLNQSATDGSINTNESLATLSEEERETVKAATNLDVAELKKNIEDARKNIKELEAEQEAGVPGANNDNASATDAAPADEKKEEEKKEEDKKEEEKKEEEKKEEEKPAAKDGAKSASKSSDSGKSSNAKSGEKLPETGEATNTAIFTAAALSVLAGLGLVAPKFKKEK